MKVDKLCQVPGDKSCILSLLKKWNAAYLIYSYLYLLWVVCEWGITHFLPVVSPK